MASKAIFWNYKGYPSRRPGVRLSANKFFKKSKNQIFLKFNKNVFPKFWKIFFPEKFSFGKVLLKNWKFKNSFISLKNINMQSIIMLFNFLLNPYYLIIHIHVLYQIYRILLPFLILLTRFCIFLSLFSTSFLKLAFIILNLLWTLRTKEYHIFLVFKLIIWRPFL